MPTLTTTGAGHIKESLSDIISQISPEETPVYSTISKTKVTQSRHEWTKDVLAAPNADNAATEGADAVAPTLTTPERVGNYCQLFQKPVMVSGTLVATTVAGKKNEMARQISKAGAEIKRDIEASIVSKNGSSTGPFKSAGMEAWIKTNASHGTGGSTAGYDANTSNVGAVVDAGTANNRVLTETMFISALSDIWTAGGTPKNVIAPGSLKTKISSFVGGGSKTQDANKKTVHQSVDIYVSDFGTVDIAAHRMIRNTTVIAYDPDLWSVAVLRDITKKDLGATGDAEKSMILFEGGLISLNEAGNAKIADVKAA